MSKPTILTTVSGYKLEWADDKVTIECTRIKESKAHTGGEVNISTNTGHLKQCYFSFTNMESRKSLAKELKDVYPVDWQTILEQLCVFVLREVRKGEPVFVMGENTVPKPEWLIDPLILARQPSIIFGAPGSAKSTVALILASLLSLGPVDVNGYRFRMSGKQHRILVLDWEQERGIVEYQLQCIRNGLGIEVPFPIFYRRCAVPITNDIDQIVAIADEYQVDTILIDSLGLAAGGDLNAPESALAFYSAIRAINRTPFIVAHTARGTESNDKHVFGSMFFEATARNIWEVVKTNDDENSVIVGMYHKKPPPFGKLQNPLGYRISFDDNATYFEWHDPKSVDELVKRMSANTQILEALKQGKMTIKQLTEMTGLTEGNIRMPLKRLRDKNLIVKIGEEYGLSVRP